MTNPLLKAAGITPDTKGHSAERALFDAAWACVMRLRDNEYSFGQVFRVCCRTQITVNHRECCPLTAFDEAAKYFQEEDV